MRLRFAAILIVWSSAVAADPCDVQTAEIVQATGARFDHRSPSGENVFLAHPLAHEFVMNCRDKGSFGPGNVSISFDGAYPPSSYFDLVARAAASSLKVQPEEVRRLAIQCHKAALATNDETAEAGSRAVSIECQSFRRDGGGTLVSVWPPRKD